MPLVYIPDNVYASNDGASSYHQPRFGFSQPQPSLSPFAFHRNEPSAAFPSAYDHDYDYGRSSPFANYTATVPQPFFYNTDPLELHKHQILAEFARKLDHAYPSLAPPMSSSSHSAAVATAAARQRYLLQQQHQKQEQEQQDLEDARRAATTHARAIEEAEQLCAQIALVERLREKQLLQTRMVERQRVVALAKQQAERERERDRQQMMLERKRQIIRLQQQEQAGQQIETSQQRQQFPAALIQLLQPQQQLRSQPAQTCQQKAERLLTPRPAESKHQQQSHAAKKDHENDENELADALQTIFKLFTTDHEEKEEKPLPKSHFIPHPSARADSPASASTPTLPKAIDTASRPASPTVSTGSRSSSPSRTPLLPSALTQLRRLQARATEVLDTADNKPSLKIEQLTKLLIEADAIESHEDPLVKKERKSFVVRVEKALEELEGVPAPAVALEAETQADASSVPVEEPKEEVVVTPAELAQIELPITEESPTANPAPVDIPAEEAAPVTPADEMTTSFPAIEESVLTTAVDPAPATTATEDDDEVLIPISSPPPTPASLSGPSPSTTLALDTFDSVFSDHSSEASDIEDIDQQPSSSRRSSSSSRRSHRVTVRDEAEEENEFTFV